MTEKLDDQMMYVEELMVRSSIQVFMADANLLKPEVFGSSCILSYQDRLFFISVFHVVNYDLTTFLETNLPPNDIGPPMHPIGGLCSYDLFEISNDMKVKVFDDLLQKTMGTLDLTFAEIKGSFSLLQPEVDFGAFKIEASNKIFFDIADIAIPDKNKTYGFFGKIKPEYNGKYLTMTPTLKNNLEFHRTNGYFHIFLAPEIILRKEDYEGCSGAPIIDSEGNLVAIACKVRVGSKMIYGFSIQECIKLIKISIETGML